MVPRRLQKGQPGQEQHDDRNPKAKFQGTRHNGVGDKPI